MFRPLAIERHSLTPRGALGSLFSALGALLASSCSGFRLSISRFFMKAAPHRFPIPVCSETHIIVIPWPLLATLWALLGSLQQPLGNLWSPIWGLWVFLSRHRAVQKVQNGRCYERPVTSWSRPERCLCSKGVPGVRLINYGSRLGDSRAEFRMILGF